MNILPATIVYGWIHRGITIYGKWRRSDSGHVRNNKQSRIQCNVNWKQNAK